MTNKPGRPRGSTRGRKQTKTMTIDASVFMALYQAKPQDMTWNDFFILLLDNYEK